MIDSVTVDRAALSLSDLVIPGEAAATGLWVATAGRPDRTWRRARTSSGETHGSMQTAAVLEQSSVPLTVYARAASAAALDTLCDEVEAAFWQFTYQLTVIENGVSKTWQADCADLKWSDYENGMADAVLISASLTIPVYPLPS